MTTVAANARYSYRESSSGMILMLTLDCKWTPAMIIFTCLCVHLLHHQPDHCNKSESSHVEQEQQ